MTKNILTKEIASLIILAIVFVAASFFAHQYKDQLAGIVESGSVLGMAGFILLTALFVVFIIPLDIAFLIPIGANLWGPVPTALMSIVGWTLGASIAFGIARLFGAPVVERMIGLQRVRAVEKRIPTHNLFLSVILLRMIVSVDILSYALGLFSNMRWSWYVAATAIGVTPFGFYFAYTSMLPFWYQLVATGAAVLLATTALFRYGFKKDVKAL